MATKKTDKELRDEIHSRAKTAREVDRFEAAIAEIDDGATVIVVIRSEDGNKNYSFEGLNVNVKAALQSRASDHMNKLKV